MQTKGEPKMDFTDLESVYNHLEEHALDYKYLHQIANLFQKIRDEMHVKKNSEEEKKAQWEIDIFNFSFNENQVQPLHTGSNEKGEKIEYPNYDRFDDSTYEYVTQRLTATAHPILKARYAHILWFSPKRHGKYAQIAVDAYLELVKLYEQKDKNEPNEHFGLSVLDTIKNAFFLSCTINDETRLNSTKSEIKRLIFNFNSESSSSFALRHNLINLMLNQTNTFSNDDFVGIGELCFKFTQSVDTAHKAISMLELGEKIDTKLRTKGQNWTKLIAERYEQLMNSRKETDSLVAITFCQDALKYYKQLKDTKKIEELEKIYNELKGKVQFKEFKAEINLEEYVKSCEKKAEKIVQYSSEEIFGLLAIDKNLLPKYNEMKSFAEKLLKEHPLQGIFPIQISDERGHIVEHCSSNEEIVFFKTLQQYKMYLEAQYLPQINAILFKGLKEKKITFAHLLNFFKNHSWFGKQLTRKIQNKDIPYVWLNLLAPSLLEYFNQMEYFMSAGIYPNLVLCIDSLILKIEGLLRDLCNHSGISTFFQTTDKKNRIISREKDLNSLLHEEKLKELFGEDDLLFFRYVLVEKGGYNLRHNIAHSLMMFQEYQIKFIQLLILMLLRIGKFDFKKKAEEKSTVSKDTVKEKDMKD